MRKSMKAALAVAAAATMTLGTTLPAAAGTGSASGGGCSVSFVNSTASDYAYSSSPNGGCGTLRVAHYYTAPGYSGYTNWYTGNTTYAATPSYPQLSSSKHQYAIYGVTYTAYISG